MKRTDLQAVADAKLADAQLLLDHRRFSNAYYLAGYAVEIGLKACVARQISAETIPDKAFINEIYRHELNRLVNLAGLTRELKVRQATDLQFAANWAIVAEWDPAIRYAGVDQYCIIAAGCRQRCKNRHTAMDESLLVEGGHNLIEELEARGSRLKAALWVHFADVDSWRLWLVPVQKLDKREFYRNVAEAIAQSDKDLYGLAASDTEMIAEDHPAVKALSRILHLEGRRSAARLESNMLNGFYLPDGIVLRMAA